MDLPVFELKIVEEGEGINKVSFVKRPAIQRNFMAFGEDKKFIQFKVSSEDKHIVTGAALIPNQLIYRVIDGNEFNVFFSEETIKQAAIQLMAKGAVVANPEHSSDTNFEGVTMFEQFISDSERGIQAPKGFEDLPNGTLYQSFYIENENLWNEIKAGTFQGFSIEGYFDMLKTEFNQFSNIENLIELSKAEMSAGQHEAFVQLIELLKTQF